MLTCTAVFSQNKLEGIVIDHHQKLLTDIPLTLTAADGNTRHQISGKAGGFSFGSINAGAYYLKVTSSNYIADSLYIQISKDTFVTFGLRPNPQQLKEVVVQTAKPSFEKKIDRFVFNVQNSSLVTGNNVWDVLRQTPLVNVQASGTLSILGLQGVSVYINDRKSILSGRDLQQYLQNMPADNIVRIEVITVPSSKYEAGNPGGIINIILKRNETEGTNASISISDRQATYNSQSGSVLLNIRKGKFGQQLVASGSVRRGYFDSENKITYLGALKQEEQINNATFKKPENSAGVTSVTDIGLSSKASLILGVDFRTTHSNDYNVGSNNISQNTNTGPKFSSYRNENPEVTNNNFLSLHLDYQYADKKNNKDLIIGVDYFDYQNKQRSRFTSYDITTPQLIHNGNQLEVDQHIRNYAGKADYSQSLKGGIQLETGVRFAHTTTDNSLGAQAYKNGDWVFNPVMSNDFVYRENIGAIYLTLQKKWSNKLETKIGGRVEHTALRNEQLTTKQKYTQDYTNFFPTVYISYTPAPAHIFSLSVKSDIRRPAYSQLNPFVYYISDKYLVKGNPMLRPSNSIMAELSYTLKRDYIFLARYTNSQRLFEQLAIVIPPDTTLLDRFNYGSADNWSLVSMINKNIVKNFWTVRLTNTLTLQNQNVAAPQVNIRTSDYLYMCNLFQQFNNLFNTKIDATIDAIYVSKAVYANSSVSGFGEVNIGLTRRIPQHNLQITLYGSDIFNTQRLKRFYARNNLSSSEMIAFSDTRSIRIAINKKLGSNKIKTAKKKEASNNEEVGRAR
ncbi:TonB-dependent receptor [Chitinophaga pendula]|uniref:TonB-dependent receptor domain-containing protein n=1 Tax=Chitinophaga TaxID=79328 RepID=UPI0018DF1F0E|nr:MULTISPECIES: TonB-dependent receptor [Chitinophaga]UCJ05645.1 TonB-dependent receptor [Chitinophaga pendula]